jgi:MFS family permease
MGRLTKKDHRQNLVLNVFHEYFWGFGLAFHTVYAIVPLFLKSLGAPNGVVISVAGLFSILVALPQFLTTVLSRNRQNIKNLAIGVHLTALPPIFMMWFVFAFFAPAGPSAWIYYYVCFILYGLSVGMIIPIWAGFLRQIVKDKDRGRFFGISFAYNSVGGFFGGIIVKILLSSSLEFPKNFGWGFAVFFMSILIATILFFWMKVEKPNTPFVQKTVLDFLKETKHILNKQYNFRRYLIARAILTVNYPAISLYAVFMQDKLGFDVSEAGIFTVINVVAYGMASYFAGLIGDRYGHKHAITLAYISNVLAVMVALLVNTMTGVYLVFFFIGIGMGAFMPSAMNLVYSFAGKRDGKLFMALIDTTIAPFTLLSIVLAGIITQLLGAVWTFYFIGIFLVLGVLILILFVKDPANNDEHTNNILV